MKKHPNIFSEEEKQIITNFFIKQKDSSKKIFDEYLLTMIKEYGQEDNTKQILLWDRDFSNVMWDEDNTIVTHFFSHPKFKFTGAALKNLHKLRPNWSYVNKDGDTALHLMTKRGIFSPSIVDKLINDFNVDVNYKNNEDKFFSWYLLKPNTIELRETNPLSFSIGELSIVHFMSNFFIQNLNHIENITNNERSILLENVKNLKKQYLEHFEKNVDKNYPNLGQQIEETFNPLIVSITKYHFDSILDGKDKKKIKTAKI